MLAINSNFFALRFGPAWSISLGVIFLLVGALGVTGLLDQLWYYLPPTWAPRFVSLMLANFFHQENIIQVAEELRKGLSVCILTSLITIILVPTWFHKWDGRPNMGDE